MKKKIVLSLFFVLLTTVTLFAQGALPCNDGDPDGVTCPIDSWVILFAVGVLIITTLYLHRKQKHIIKKVLPLLLYTKAVL